MTEDCSVLTCDQRLYVILFLTRDTVFLMSLRAVQCSAYGQGVQSVVISCDR